MKYLSTAIVFTLSFITIKSARWVRYHRARACVEVSALLGPGFALMAAWASSQGARQISAALTAAAIFLSVFACLTARVPTWPGKGKRKRPAQKERARLRDLPEILRLTRLSFGRVPVSPVLLAWLIVRGGCYVERDAGQIAGVVATFPLRGGITWIELLAVHPDHRRRGVGARLLCDLEPVYLIVRARNTGALAFYRRVGFEVLELWPGYYEGGEGAVVMGK